LIVLANEHGVYYKVDSYKKSLDKLKCALTKKMKEMSNSDKQKDIAIMLKNTEILMMHVNKDF